ncbi:MAG: hypothetical protein FWC32_10920 [Firmicutes bacterium]|nr:hypothetical protein [Bacillota bacterium]
MQMINPFAGKQIRCFYDGPAEKWWYSAVDICAILTGSDYDTARKYWKQLKHDLAARKNQLVRESDQLKMPAANGKYYFTDVLDFREVVYLVQIIPSPKAEPFRLWLAEVVANSTDIEAALIEAGAESVKEIQKHINKTGDGYEQLNITKKDIPLSLEVPHGKI